MFLQAPSSKSIAQRAIAAALLSDGTSVIENVTDCNDTAAALRLAQELGAKVIREDGILRVETVRPVLDFGFSTETQSTQSFTERHCERSEAIQKNNVVNTSLNAGESALSLRMFAPIAALSGKEVTLSGEGSLLNRPIEMIVNALSQGGVHCTTNNGRLPLTLSGRLKSGHFHIDGSVTSQVLTGLLMALPVVEGDSVVVVENLKSKPYIDITLDVLKSFGIEIENIDYHTFKIRGNQRYTPCRYVVEGDWSSAAFWMVAGAIYNDVSVSGLNPNSKQADRAILDALKKANCTVEYRHGVFTSRKSEVAPFTFDASDCPDLIPVLTLLAACATGVSRIYGADRLAHKESDRAAVLIQQFVKVGIVITQYDDILEITGGAIRGCVIDPHNDHRIAMTFTIASLVATSEMVVEHTECINKSYPGFFRDFDRLERY
ncbi:MAG: 3-phosphoshikimate 1-carboxyvinyltransferase [Bacteroidales bacterium]|nr:3-phosphoshikimate 1-carboxyvinyltransferase [Bacteroidales bacterium]